MKFSIADFFSKCDQIRRKLRIWSHLLKKSLRENFIFCAVNVITPNMRLHKTKRPLQNWCLNHFFLSINKRVIIETLENKSIRSQTEETL